MRSHIRGLERAWGESGVRELEKRMGHPLNYGNNDDVAISEEVRMLEHIVDITSATELSRRDRELEAGRLHFRNFATTPVWTLVQELFGAKLKFLLMQSSKIAGYVFQDVAFTSEDVAPHTVRISMFNNDYPLEHFQGFFEAWLHDAEVKGSVEAAARGRGRYEYTISWAE